MAPGYAARGCKLWNWPPVGEKEKKMVWNIDARWKEIEEHEVESVDGLPNPIVAFPAEAVPEAENGGLSSAAVDGYCPVDCQVQVSRL